MDYLPLDAPSRNDNPAEFAAYVERCRGEITRQTVASAFANFALDDFKQFGFSGGLGNPELLIKHGIAASDPWGGSCSGNQFCDHVHDFFCIDW